MTTTYRQTPVQSIYAEVLYNTTNIATGVAIGTIPNTAKLLSCRISVTTAFNAGSSNSLNVGTTATGTELAHPSVTLAGTVGVKDATAGLTLNPFSLRTIYASYQQTGGAATAGRAFIVILYTL